MKLNSNQIAVIKAVRLAGKANYAQATADGGNGRTLGALVENRFLKVNPPTAKRNETTYELDVEGKAYIREEAKAARKAEKSAAKQPAAV
ncbi:MAG: hypothetical protein E6R03_04640 [Hyphomicrobiaceae bacterium]|nr:MAG: hypothetical protein E6R03_04640 [Hyphomicrobiaceae bacterium]